MPTMVNDESMAKSIQAQRAESGLDRWDEVWDGVYMVMPLPNNEHQGIVAALVAILMDVVGFPGLGSVSPGVNVSDRDDAWESNYRGPDVTVYLRGTAAINRSSHWLGGPDFAVEIISRGDRVRQKLDFYAGVGVRELLIVDRFPWSIELHRLRDGELVLAGRSTAEGGESLASEVVPLAFRLIAGEDRPKIEVTHPTRDRPWIF